jgi:phage gp45-like
MEEVILNFVEKINVSLAPGDTVYYLKNSKPIKLGTVITVSNDRLSCNVNRSISVTMPDYADYIFFSKPAETEVSGIIGYEATTTLVNDSTDRAELYAISSEVFQSSI